MSRRTMEHRTRFLFVGNSFTRIGNLPELVTAMLNSRQTATHCEAESSLADGKNLQWHWNEGDARERIAAGRFDFVVLQGSSLSAYGSPGGGDGYTPEAMATCAGKLVELARSCDSAPVLYCTQAASGKPEDLGAVVETYLGLARSLDVPVALCGAAWQRAHRQEPELRLDVGDGYCHQNRNGLYLSACVFYALFSGHSPLGLWPLGPSRRPGARPRPAGPADEPTARLLERIARDTVRHYATEGDVKVFVDRPL